MYMYKAWTCIMQLRIGKFYFKVETAFSMLSKIEHFKQFSATHIVYSNETNVAEIDNL